MPVELEIDGSRVRVDEGTNLWEACRAAGREVPVLCHDPALRPVGVCRVCAVEVEGARTLVASCVREAEAGMVVRTDSARVQRARRGLAELLLAEQPAPAEQQGSVAAGGGDGGSDELRAFARAVGAEPDGARRGSEGRAVGSAASGRGRDDSSAVIRVDHRACILCDRCLRACDEVQHNLVIGRTGKGHGTRIGFDLDAPMGESSCVSCGECVAACPTAALVDRPIAPHPAEARSAEPRPAEARLVEPRPAQARLDAVDTVCPYCGVGCALTYSVDRAANRVVSAQGRDSPGNRARLCVKGRYGWDYASHPQRLTRPLIRSDYPKRGLSQEVAGGRRDGRKAGGLVDYAEVLPAFREASWEEALDLVARRLGEIKTGSGPNALAGFGSAKCSNEEAYLFQKLVRAVFGTNNVDHCTRLCHASSVAALLEMIGSGAVTTTFGDVEHSDFVLVTGSNTTANHPVAATFIKQAAARGARLVVVDPRHSPIADHAWHFCQIRSGSDVAFYNALMNVIVAEDRVDRDFIRARTRGFDAACERVSAYTPEMASAICGIAPEVIREVARAYADADAALTFWGMGMSQHVHGTDNCRSIISLALMTGNLGRSGAGLHPLRGQNNVQGASDAGLIPMFFPDYQSVASADARARFEKAWGVALDPEPGLTVVEIIAAAREGRIRGMYMLGENPFLSDPNTNKVREALARLDFLVVQDIFLTETAEFADVILPATSALEKTGTFTNTDRRVQMGHDVIEAPGEVRLDWQLICDIATRMGYPMHYDDTAQVFDEFASLTTAYRGLSHGALGEHGKLYPCPEPETSAGTVVMFSERFPTEDGRARFSVADHSGADELPDNAYPFVLVTGRVLEHWHTGVMTRRSQALATLEPEAFVQVCPDDCERLGLRHGQRVRVSSRRGEIELDVRESRSVQPGSVFIPFHFREAAANMLTTDRLDPDGKIPEFKFCAVRLEPVA